MTTPMEGGADVEGDVVVAAFVALLFGLLVQRLVIFVALFEGGKDRGLSPSFEHPFYHLSDRLGTF